MENMQTVGNVVGGVAGAMTGLGGLGAMAGGLAGLAGGGGGQQQPFQGSTGMQANNYYGGQAPQTNFATGYNPYNPNMAAPGMTGTNYFRLLPDKLILNTVIGKGENNDSFKK